MHEPLRMSAAPHELAQSADEDDDIEALEVTFDQFSVWMKSSSPLADAYRQFLGGVVDDQLCALVGQPVAQHESNLCHF